MLMSEKNYFYEPSTRVDDSYLTKFNYFCK